MALSPTKSVFIPTDNFSLRTLELPDQKMDKYRKGHFKGLEKSHSVLHRSNESKNVCFQQHLIQSAQVFGHMFLNMYYEFDIEIR